MFVHVFNGLETTYADEMAAVRKQQPSCTKHTYHAHHHLPGLQHLPHAPHHLTTHSTSPTHPELIIGPSDFRFGMQLRPAHGIGVELRLQRRSGEKNRGFWWVVSDLTGGLDADERVEVAVACL